MATLHEQTAEKIRAICCIVWDQLPDGHPLHGVDDKLAAILQAQYGPVVEAVPPKNVPVWCMQAAQDISISGAIVARPHLEHVRIDVSDMARTIALRLKQEYDRLLLYLDEYYPSLSCPHCNSGRLERDVPNGPDAYNCLECGQFTRGGVESFTFTREQWEKDILPRLFADGTGRITERQ